MGHWIEIAPGKKRFIVEQKPQPRIFGRAPVMHISDKGTQLEGLDSKFGNTAPMKMRRKLLQTQGKRALAHSYKK